MVLVFIIHSHYNILSDISYKFFQNILNINELHIYTLVGDLDEK